MAQQPHTDATNPLKDAADNLLVGFGSFLRQCAYELNELIEEGIAEESSMAQFENFRLELPEELREVHAVIVRISEGDAGVLGVEEKSFLELEPTKPGGQPALRRDVLGQAAEYYRLNRESEYSFGRGLIPPDQLRARESADHDAEQSEALHKEFLQLAILYRDRGRSASR